MQLTLKGKQKRRGKEIEFLANVPILPSGHLLTQN